MNLFENLQQFSESLVPTKEDKCCKGTFHFINNDGDPLSMDEPELNEYKKYDGAEVKIIGNHVMNDETGEGYVDIEFPDGEVLDYISSSYIKYDIEESTVLKDEKDMEQVVETKEIKNEARSLSTTEFNRMKYVLNKHNTLKKIFVLHPSATDTVGNSEYSFKIQIYGSFVDYENNDNHYKGYHDGPKYGEGVRLYTATINLIDESINISDYMDEYGIKRYIKLAMSNNILSDMDVETVISNIKTIIDESKKDLEELLKSKNFIYRLTGKNTKTTSDSEYNLDLNENTKLTEDFDSSMPNWLKRAIRINNQKSGRHKDFSYDFELDKLKWTVDTTPEKGKLSQYTEKGYLYAVLIDASGDRHAGQYIVYSPSLNIGYGETIEVNGRNRDIENMSMKALAPYIKEIAYTQLDNDDLRQKVRNRADSQQGTIDRYTDKTRSNVYGASDKLDKSGYVKDPKKYQRLLAQNNASKYSEELEDLYTVITGVKDEIYKIISNNDILADPKEKYASKTSASIKFTELEKDYYNACRYYSWATDSLDKLSQGKSADYWGGEGFESFKKYVSDANKIVAEMLEKIDSFNK